MTEPRLLREASVQEIQLELLRRTRIDALDGERVYVSLLSHRQLWLAALLDRPGLPNYAVPGELLVAGLIKLRDLPENFWNADTLFILTPTIEQAHQLARLAEAEDWAGEIRVHEDPEELTQALGAGRQGYGLLTVWWD
jgi:hypothetical protein